MSRANPDRSCLAIVGKAACAKELDRRTGAPTQEACCRGFKGGCVTYPTTCYAPMPLKELLPARVRMARGRAGCPVLFAVLIGLFVPPPPTYFSNERHYQNKKSTNLINFIH